MFLWYWCSNFDFEQVNADWKDKDIVVHLLRFIYLYVGTFSFSVEMS